MSDPDGKPWVAPALILALTFLALAPTLAFDFVFDDRALIVDNPALGSWAAVPDYFRGHLWSSVFPNRPGHFYRPLLLVFYRLNAAVFGLAAWGWHLSHVLMHLAATALSYLLARRVLGCRQGALLVMLVFGLHPIHAEAVAWVAGGNEPFHAVFFLGAALCAMRWSAAGERSCLAWLAAALGLHALALLSKETAFVLPAIVGLGAAALSRRDEGLLARFLEGVRVGLPFAVLAALALGLRFLALGQVAGGQSEVSVEAMALTWPSLALRYLRSLLWPVGLAPAYSFGLEDSLPGAGLAALALLILGLGLGAWGRSPARRGPLVFALGLLVLPLLPVFNLRALPADDFVHDRFLYLPSLGFALLLGLAARDHAGLVSKKARTALSLALAAAMVAGLVAACRPWRENLSLFRRGVEAAPGSPIMRNNLATELMAIGATQEARAQLRQAIELDPKNWLALYNLGYSYHRANEAEAAARYLGAAVALSPRRSPQASILLALNLMRLKRHDEAQAAVDQGLALDPRARGFHYVAGLVARARGDRSAARRAFRQELRLYPNQAAAKQALKELEESDRGG